MSWNINQEMFLEWSIGVFLQHVLCRTNLRKPYPGLIFNNCWIHEDFVISEIFRNIIKITNDHKKMSPNVMKLRSSRIRKKSFNLTWWHFMTFGDIWWLLMTFDDFSWQNHVVYHDMSCHIMNCHDISPTNSERMGQMSSIDINHWS